MSDRSRLHELVDTLPDATLNFAHGALEHYQAWPPQVRPFDRRTYRMRQSMRPSTTGGGGSYRMGPGGRVEYGHQSHSHWEDDAVVIETHRFHAGHELEIEERLRLAEGGTKLEYVHLVTGPDGSTDRRGITFEVRK
jgi:hypothetical protein